MASLEIGQPLLHALELAVGQSGSMLLGNESFGPPGTKVVRGAGQIDAFEVSAAEVAPDEGAVGEDGVAGTGPAAVGEAGVYAGEIVGAP